MTTPPLDPDFVARIASGSAIRFTSQLGLKFTPRFFCCDDPNALGITEGKEPVCHISLSPNPAFVGDTINYDSTSSYDPDGSIVSQQWTFPSGTPASSTASSGTVSWAATGIYDVRLTVRDGTSKRSNPCIIQMEVVEPEGVYYIATSTGVYFTDDGGQSWTDKNNGLSGDSLKVNSVKIDPATQNLQESQKIVWAATDGGIYVSKAGASWNLKNPQSVSNKFSDAPAPTVGDLRFTGLTFGEGILFAISNWINGSAEERGWIFATTDLEGVRASLVAGVNWSELP